MTRKQTKDRAHSPEYERARRMRARGVSDAVLREAIDRLGDERVRELMRVRKATMGRLVREAESVDGDTAVHRSERDAYITLAAGSFSRIEELVGLKADGATAGQGGSRGRRAGASSDAYHEARRRRARGVGEAEIRAAIAVLGSEHVRELLARPRVGHLVGLAERSTNDARRGAYLMLAACRWQAARRLVASQRRPEVAERSVLCATAPRDGGRREREVRVVHGGVRREAGVSAVRAIVASALGLA